MQVKINNNSKYFPLKGHEHHWASLIKMKEREKRRRNSNKKQKTKTNIVLHTNLFKITPYLFKSAASFNFLAVSIVRIQVIFHLCKGTLNTIRENITSVCPNLQSVLTTSL